MGKRAPVFNGLDGLKYYADATASIPGSTPGSVASEKKE